MYTRPLNSWPSVMKPSSSPSPSPAVGDWCLEIVHGIVLSAGVFSSIGSEAEVQPRGTNTARFGQSRWVWRRETRVLGVSDGGGRGRTGRRGARGVAGEGSEPSGETRSGLEPVSRTERATRGVETSWFSLARRARRPSRESWSHPPRAQQPRIRRTSSKHGPQVSPHSSTHFQSD